MKSLSSSTSNQSMIERINLLTPASKAEWGKMNVSQMLARTFKACGNDKILEIDLHNKSIAEIFLLF